MPDDDDLAVLAVEKAIDVLGQTYYKKQKNRYIYYKTKYNIARCLERIHSSVPRKYFEHALTHRWREGPRDRDNIGAYAIRGFQMEKPKPGSLAPRMFIKDKELAPSIRKLEPTVSDRLMSTIENFTDEEIRLA